MQLCPWPSHVLASGCHICDCSPEALAHVVTSTLCIRLAMRALPPVSLACNAAHSCVLTCAYLACYPPAWVVEAGLRGQGLVRWPRAARRDAMLTWTVAGAHHLCKRDNTHIDKNSRPSRLEAQRPCVLTLGGCRPPGYVPSSVNSRVPLLSSIQVIIAAAAPLYSGNTRTQQANTSEARLCLQVAAITV